jgi:hypothetical protein
LWDIDTGHDLMINEGEKTAASLDQVAAGLKAVAAGDFQL